MGRRGRRRAGAVNGGRTLKPIQVPGESPLEARRRALLSASENLAEAKSRAARTKHTFMRAQGAEAKRKARRGVENALSDLRVAALEHQAASFNIRRVLTPNGRQVLDDLLRRLARQVARYEEASRRFAEVSAGYESAREHYMRERAAIGRARVPPRFDGLLAKLESALTARDKSIALAHAAHRETLDKLHEAMDAHDEFTRRPTGATRERRNAAWDAARHAFSGSNRHTNDLTAALEGWFEADNEFSLAVAALEATRGIPQVHRLEARALDMLRASARLTLASILSDEAAQELAATIGEVKLLR